MDLKAIEKSELAEKEHRQSITSPISDGFRVKNKVKNNDSLAEE